MPIDPVRQAELDEIVRRSREAPMAPSRRRGPGRGTILGFLVLLLSLVVAGIAAILVLPAADITVTPHIEPVGPVSLVVRADPGATAADPVGLVIPATSVSVPVGVSAEFPATGKRIVTTAAKGSVRWRNCDPSASYSMPQGTTVRTAGGIAFEIDESVFLPVAVISGSGNNVSLRCQTSEVTVKAVEPGPRANVAAGAIRVVPARYNRTLITVTNPAATKGGAKDAFTRVSDKDVAAAMAALREQLSAQFAIELEDPAGVPAGASVVPGTEVLGTPSPTVDPVTLVDKEVAAFTLGLTAEGTVLAVDPSPARAMAEAALATRVTPGWQLVPGSVTIQTGDPTAADGTVSVLLTGSARQVQPVDRQALEKQIQGLSEAEARSRLAPFGDVRIDLWPGWVTTVPTLSQRVILSVAEPVEVAPTPSPSGTGDGSLPGQRLPSG